MGLEDSGRRREGPSRGPHSILHAAGLRSSTLRPSRGFLEGGRGVDGPEEAQAAGPRLDELKRRLVRAVVSNSLRPHGLHLPRLLCPWDSPRRNTGVGCYTLLQGTREEHWSALPFPSPMHKSEK